MQVAQQHADVGFEFIKALAKELSTGSLELPSLPSVVTKIRSAMNDPECSIDVVTRLVSSDPALAARILTAGNSALLSRGSKPITDVRTAVMRMGLELVRNIAMSYAMNQLSIDSSGPKQASALNALWEQSVRVAAISSVVANKFTSISPDEALLAGLLHNLGRTYIVMRSANFPELLDDGKALEQVFEDWHAGIARAIIESWEHLDALAVAVEAQDVLDRPGTEAPDLADVIIASKLLSQLFQDADGECECDPELHDLPSFKRLGIDESASSFVINEASDEIDALSQMLKS